MKKIVKLVMALALIVGVAGIPASILAIFGSSSTGSTAVTSTSPGVRSTISSTASRISTTLQEQMAAAKAKASELKAKLQTELSAKLKAAKDKLSQTQKLLSEKAKAAKAKLDALKKKTQDTLKPKLEAAKKAALAARAKAQALANTDEGKFIIASTKKSLSKTGEILTPAIQQAVMIGAEEAIKSGQKLTQPVIDDLIEKAHKKLGVNTKKPEHTAAPTKAKPVISDEDIITEEDVAEEGFTAGASDEEFDVLAEEFEVAPETLKVQFEGLPADDIRNTLNDLLQQAPGLTVADILEATPAA